jgi:hypothetical protein
MNMKDIVNESGEKIGETDGHMIWDTRGVATGYQIDGDAAFCLPMDGRIINGHLREENGMLVLTD